MDNRTFDSQERWYRETLPLAGKVIADVGANVGRLSQFFWQQGGPSCEVTSIEPLAENADAIAARIASAGASNWHLERCAVSNVEGTVTMAAFDVGYGMNSVVAVDAAPARGEKRAVPCRRLEDLVPGAEVIKVDIEGHEYAVLPDALERLDRAVAWALELHMVDGHPLQETLSRFAGRGYRLLAAGRRRDDPSTWVSVPITPALGWDHIPGTPTASDGVVFKMLHVIALRS